MKIRLYRFITAIALMLMTPLVMACGSCHENPGVGVGVDIVYQVSKTDVTSLNVPGIVTAKSGLIQNTVLSRPAITYEQPRTMKLESKFKGNEKITRNVIVHAYPGRNLYSGVTTA